MKKGTATFYASVVFLFFMIVFVCSKAYSLGDVVKDEIIVKFKPGVHESLKMTVNSNFSAYTKNKIDLSMNGIKNEFEVIKLPAGMSVNEAIEIYSSLPEVELVQPNYIRHAFVVNPDDPEFLSGLQWGLGKINAPEAWGIVKGSASIIIAVIDTGVDYNHIDLSLNVITFSDYDFVNNDSYAMDDNGHGTHVAGIIAAVTNNSEGIAGVSWYSKILPVKVLDSNGNGNDADISQGIRYAADKGAKIINMSFGDTLYPPQGGSLLRTACRYAYNKGCVLVCASGNGYDTDNNGYIDRDDTFDMISYPAAFSECIAVGASDLSDERVWFSNYGSKLDVVAPGVNILSTVSTTDLGPRPPGGNKMWDSSGYWEDNGTSMAAPFVSGIAALILSESPGSLNSKVRWILRTSADDVRTPGFDNYTGYGRVNAYGALTFEDIPVVSKSVNYPNPFYPKNGDKTYLVIPDSIVGSYMIVKIYNIAGELVRTLDKTGEVEPFGFAKWDGKNDDSDMVASGIYFYTAETDKGMAKGKLTLIK